ncbi:titin isoform X1 [Aedes aegypti]|uniref:Resistance to inhibitors of cholinesterase protein 3 N-terminal domain-containing protein n=1 Tax=Aedes aegypti TaxID=7159 RepID=A0A6I8TTI9_AEDAE|nr:titin isoform X1 [Aedes aegypti]XP_021698733.1 titin isoform X1 [Aedes aegypti]XP_021698734.1 titin isoform X1 [Aedes aegypti]XP_021698736.1 titin isoform X1 [Aedes aegypti]XP_021698737.1 titin isoform X1 [Aedes aegypti]XP_021698738.1 titin isoform X1 [Aedes aegypti]XP_021698739.1 titin isoform X1 [Aedes aegypti]
MATTVNSRHTEPNGGTLGPRKTLIIMVTVVGCIAILWPKVFYPMMVGPTQTKTVIKDHRGSGCCDVVLDQEETFANMSINVPNQQNLFRKRNIGPTVEDHSIRQERPPHLRPETIHPAMRERGRAIPHVGSTHSERPQSPPRIVEGRPGPIPGMRPPMGAGSHQSTKSANSMGFIMPLYTIGIVSFFIYTILKLIFKKTPATPYPEIKPDTTFRNEVFTAPDQPYMKRPDSGTTKLGQPIANGENGAPASVGPVSNGSASASFNHSVQAEISVDYQQLAAQSESRPATTDSSVAEEQVTEITTPVEQDKSEASSASEATNDDECVQPEYDPATEKVVDGIVVQKIVQLNEEESTSKVIERVASQVVDEVLQEAESKINEAAEAAAVELVEMVVEQAEAAVLAAELDGIEEIEQFVKYVEDSATVEENMKIDQPSVSVEEPIEEAETVEETPVTEDIVICHEPVLDTNAVAESSETKEVTFADNGPQLISDELSELKQDIETNSEITVCQNVSETEQTVKVSESIEVTSKPENVEASEQENIFTFDSNKICDEKLSESPIELVPELETSIEVSISETLSSEEPVFKEKTLKEVIVDTIEENITVPNEPEAIEVEDKMSEPLEDSEKLTPAQEVAVEGVEEETVETTKSTEIEMEQEVEIPVDDEATADEVIQVLKEVLHSSAGHEEPQQISNEEQIAESPISEVTEPTQECEVDATASEGLETVDDEKEITQETPTDTETVLTPTETETVETENVKGVTFADEVVVDTSKVEDLEEQVSEEIPSSETEKTTTSDESLDTEEMAIKVLAAKMEETIAEQAEEIEVRSIAEELVNEVLEQAEEIANEKVALDSYELPSYDPATQKLVDGEVINRYVSDGEASNVAASTPVVEEVVESVSIEQVSAVCAEALGSAPENTLPSENDTDQLTSDITEESQPFEQETRQIVEDNVIVIKETVVESSGDVKLPVDNAEVAVSVDQHITLDNITDNAHINEENQENIHSSEASVEPSIIETTFTDLKEGVKIEEPVEQAVEEMAHDSAPQEQIVEEVPQDEVELEATETISVNEQSEGEATSLSEEPIKSEVVESESADEILVQEEAHQDTSSEHVGVDHENQSIEARDCKVSTEINLPEHMSVVEQEITVEEASAELKNDESSEAVETLSVSPELSTCETSMTIEDTTLPDCTVVQESLFEVQAAPEASEAPFESSVLEITSSEATVELVAPDVKETKDVTAFKETTENKLCEATVELVAPDVEETKAVTELKETTENKLDTVAPETTTDAPVEEQTAVAVEADASVEAVPSVDACNEDETLKIETDVTTETDVTEQVGTEESFSDSPGEVPKEEPILESSAFVQIESTSADVGSDEQTGTVEDLKEPELENVSDSATKEVETLTESLEHKVVDGEAADINELEPIVNEAQDSNESQTFETVAEELPVTKDAEM